MLDSPSRAVRTCDFSSVLARKNNIETEIEKRGFEIHKFGNDVARFQIDDVEYIVEASRFQLFTSAAPWIKIADMANMIFGELLAHTPILAFGINHEIHFNTPSIESRIELGRQLAPIEPWGAYGKQYEESNESSAVVPTSLTMQRRQLTDEVEFETNVKIEPSVVLTGDCGVYMDLNYHHKLLHNAGSFGATEAIELLLERFDGCISEAEEIFDQIMGLFQ